MSGQHRSVGRFNTEFLCCCAALVITFGCRESCCDRRACPRIHAPAAAEALANQDPIRGEFSSCAIAFLQWFCVATCPLTVSAASLLSFFGPALLGIVQGLEVRSRPSLDSGGASAAWNGSIFHLLSCLMEWQHAEPLGSGCAGRADTGRADT